MRHKQTQDLVSITFPKDLNNYCKSNNLNRSDFIRRACYAYLKNNNSDLGNNKSLDELRHEKIESFRSIPVVSMSQDDIKAAADLILADAPANDDDYAF
jgi:hypothetical protein